MYIREWPFNTGRGWGVCQENWADWIFFLHQGEEVECFLDPEGGIDFFFHTSLANIFHQCYEKAVFMKNMNLGIYKI